MGVKMKQLCNWLLLVSVASAAVLGIDFGQDFSKAVVVAPGVPFEIILSSDSKRKEPSGIAFKKLQGDNNIERLYGSATMSHCTRFPQSCMMGLKPLLGRSVEDESVISRYLETHPGLDILPAKNNRSTISFNVYSHQYPVEEIVAMNFQNIVSRTGALLKEKAPGGYSHVSDVVITVPGFFNQAQRAAIQDAAELAGLKIIALVDDGLAIAINYATKHQFDLNQKQYHIIYDMGAGSTKATLVSYEQLEDEPLKISIEGYAYDETLGGAFFTNAIASLIKEKFLGHHSKIRSDVFSANHRSISKIQQASEKAKLILSANNDATISIESLYEDIDFRTRITRQEFEDFISDSASRITRPIIEVFQNCYNSSENTSLKDITSVIYAGGSTRVPFVKEHLLALLGPELISKTINADEAAVMGATLRGILISKQYQAKQYNIKEPSMFSYEISYDDGEKQTVFPFGTPYDSTKELELTSLFNSTKNFTIDVYEGSNLYSHYDVSKIDSSIRALDFNSTECTKGFKIIGNFKLSESRLFSLEFLEAVCDVVEQNSVPQKVKIPTKIKYNGARPLGSASKKNLKLDLLALSQKEEQRRQLFEKLNELEAVLYNFRYYLEEEEVISKVPKSLVENATAIVFEYLEWLDDRNEDVSSKDIRLRIDTIKNLKSSIENYLQQLEIPLDNEAFEKLHEDGILCLNSLQDLMLKMNEEANEMRLNYTLNGLEFDKEVKKLKLRSPKFTQDEINEVSKALVDTLQEIQRFYENKKLVQQYDREELLKYRNRTLDIISKIEAFKTDLDSNLKYRMKELNGALLRHQKAQKRAISKSKQMENSTTSTTSTISASHEHDEL